MKLRFDPKGDALAARLLRFAGVGVFVTGSYAVSTWACIEWVRLTPIAASLVASSVAITVSYLGQKYVTFRSDAGHRVELPKFLLACMLAVATSTASITWVTERGLDYRIGILIAALVLPLCNFTVMNLWVFAAGRAGARRRDAT